LRKKAGEGFEKLNSSTLALLLSLCCAAAIVYGWRGVRRLHYA
jgi:hypothetical protein